MDLKAMPPLTRPPAILSPHGGAGQSRAASATPRSLFKKGIRAPEWGRDRIARA